MTFWVILSLVCAVFCILKTNDIRAYLQFLAIYILLLGIYFELAKLITLLELLK